MYCIDDILHKLNSASGSTSLRSVSADNQAITLSDVIPYSFAEVKELAGDSLSWGEKNFLYQQAQQELKENKLVESRILSRANPQLANAVRLGIRQSSMLDSYHDLFPQRADRFVKPGSVASMFSPAGYLTELYREARNLHSGTSGYQLDTRRPDLASLPLSQSNMDDELSTLALSNELLLNSIQAQQDKTCDGVLEMLSTYRLTGATPYSQPYEATRQAILLQDAELAAFRRNPAVAAKMDTSVLLGIEADISPELDEILTEEITEKNVAALLAKNFGDANTTALQNIAYMAHYYGLTHDEMSALMGLLTAGETIAPGVHYYKNDQLVRLVEQNGSLNAEVIKRSSIAASSEVVDAEIIPLGDGSYLFNFSVKATRSAAPVFTIGTTGYISANVYRDNNFVPEKGKFYSLAINLTTEMLSKGVTLSVSRTNSRGSGYNSVFTFKMETWPFSVFLLKLNKLIRLYKASGISPSDIRTVIESNNNDLTITRAVLSQLFWVRYYMRRYSIDADRALVLSGAPVSQISHDNTPDAFTRLFNTPPLNGQTFSADGTALSLKPGVSGDTFRLAALKRALQVNDTELYTLWSLATDKDSPPDFACNINNLSTLYRLSLLAHIHDLSVTGLSALLSVSPFASKVSESLTGTGLAGLISFLDQYTRWLKEQNWTVSELYLMLTRRYSTALSPEIENLLSTLKNGLANQDLSAADEAGLINAAAPFIAAAMQLDSAEMAAAVLQWQNQLKPQGLTVAGFLALVNNDNRKDEDTTKLVSYCQVLGQLTLIVRSAGLSATELLQVVTQPDVFIEGTAVLAHDITTLYELTCFHRFILRCGTSASEIIRNLSNLRPATVATALSLDLLVVEQGLAQTTKWTNFHHWSDISVTLQWVDIASTLGITPAVVAKLAALNYSDPKKQPSYQDWVDISHTLQAGLNTRQTAQLQAILDEGLSAAVSAYVIKNIAPIWVTNRNELHSWLLIDNQVSARVKTTRVAEAIASVQLYVSRALRNQEEGVVSAVRSRQFFIDWDTYNKRYSTWAGVSQLVYYPENYVDPTIRLGQTGMMDEMLQSLSQSQLTSDSVEDAFKSYMTRFEEIANLDVISGYHDSVSDKNGTTYLIGRSDIGDYYWRSADIDKMSDGKLPANAWREWKKITTAISAVNNLIRPVIFQSRLYLVWVEARETATVSGNTTIQSTKYLLNYAHIRHDGTWSGPVSVQPDTDTLPPKAVSIDDTGMYCARDVDQEKLYIFFYQKESSYSSIPKKIAGLSIFSDGHVDSIAAGNLAETVGYIYKQMDTTTDVRLNTLYVHGETTISISRPEQVGLQWGEGKYTYITNSMLSDMSATIVNGQISLKLSATARVIYKGLAGDRSQTLVNMMKSAGNLNDEFYLPGSVRVGDYAQGQGFGVECIAKKQQPAVYFLPTASYMPLNNGFGGYRYDFLYTIGASAATPSILTARNNQGLWWKSDAGAVLPKYITAGRADMTPTPSDFIFSNFKYINTSIRYTNVYLSVTGGGTTLVSDECPKYTWDESLFVFRNKTATLPATIFNNNTAEVTFTFSATAPAGDGRSLGSETFRVMLTRTAASSLPVITLNHTNTYAQYLQYGVSRIRVNTLFARQLVARANTGLNAVLSMETQQLQEPQLGTGSYIEVVIPAYNASVHGSNRKVSIQIANNNTGGNNNAKHTFWSGLLNDAPQEQRIFVPTIQEKGGMHFPYDRNNGLDLYLTCAKGMYLQGTFKNIRQSDLSLTTFTPNSGRVSSRDVTVTILNVTTEPMDFSGANALYFWEMFYYVPMMAFKRQLQEDRFTDATQWLKYIWDPDGYLVHGEPATYQWNVRPLEEDSSWNASPLDSVDPDAVAQADPMHYKVATFMAFLDLLIARGDMAYRMLERDTLAEAKMWYVQALDMLGDKPYLALDAGWASPRLNDAANKTTQTATQQALMAVRQQVSSGMLRSANSLTDLFLPQQNEKLAGYWQTLAQRLFNLRHNLSIDGNPLSLAIFAAPADPAALLSAAVMASSGGSDLPAPVMSLYRFPLMLESARGMVSQLTQFGSTLLSLTERQDAEALSELLQTQGAELVLQSIALQNTTLAEIDADKAALEESRSGAQSRLASYTRLYNEGVNSGEWNAMNLYLSSSSLAMGGQVFHTTGGALDLAPNIFGVACGGSRWGAAFIALGNIADLAASATRTTADNISQTEAYRRRREEWEIQRNAAQSDVRQIDAQLNALAVRREGAVLQKTYLETQQSQTQAQMTFLQNKFSNKALYNWLRGKLAAIYYQFYDLSVSRCLMAEEAYKWAQNESTATFIRPGAWQGTYAGLMAGETLMLSLGQMEQVYLQKEERQKEVTRTVCLSEFYSDKKAFSLTNEVTKLVTSGSGSAGTEANGLKVANNQLQASVKLSDLSITGDYPDALGKTRRIRQISVTLPTLMGPYQDVRAVLSYSGSVVVPRGCDALAVSHGMNDSGQFQLDFNDSRWLPFEGIPVNDTGTLVLSFPDMTGKQKDLLLSLTDIILHIRYTIVS